MEARLETKNGQIFYRLLRRKPFENAAPARLRNVARLVGAMVLYQCAFNAGKEILT
jgi:hypothetical protein